MPRPFTIEEVLQWPDNAEQWESGFPGIDLPLLHTINQVTTTLDIIYKFSHSIQHTFKPVKYSLKSHRF
jgi:hypothetical protein